MKLRIMLVVTFLLGFVCACPTRGQLQCSFSGYSSPTGLAWENNTGSTGTVWVAVFGGNYVARLSGCAEIARYAVGREPFGIANDGTNMWVTNYGDGTVTKINIGTGRTVGTYSVGGSHPRGVLFLGGYIFVANQSSNTVTKLEASTGALLGTFAVGSAPYTLVSAAGNTLWVGNTASYTAMQLDLNGNILQTISTCNDPQYLAYAEDSYGNQRLFASCYNTKKVAVYNAANPASLINIVDVSAYSYPTGIVALPNGPGSFEATVEVVTHGGYLLDIKYEGTPGYGISTVYRIETSPSTHLLSVIVTYPNYNPYSIWIDDVDDGKVYSYLFQGL